MNALIIGITLPLLGTMLGSAFVFFMKKTNAEPRTVPAKGSNIPITIALMP